MERSAYSEQSKTERFINLCVKVLFVPFGTGESVKMESDNLSKNFVSSIEAYQFCRYRDLCLRYMGENPSQWIDVNTTPCPCDHTFFRKIEAYARVLECEKDVAVLPCSRYHIVDRITEKPTRRIKPPKQERREIPLTQKRLNYG